MAIDPVPYAVEGGRHSAGLFRFMGFTLTGGAEGVSKPTALRVLAWTTPGTGFKVMPGGALINNRAAGYVDESYAVRVLSAETQSTGSSGSSARHLLVCAVIKNPLNGEPWTTPANGEDGPFWGIEVYNCSATTTSLQSLSGYANYSGIALARIDLPANVTTIQNSHITDLRELATPRRSEVVWARPRVAADVEAQNFLTATTANGGELFPGGSGYANQFEVDVPAWATRMVIDASWLVVCYAANRNPYGEFWIEYGDQFKNHLWDNKQYYEFATQHFYFNAPGTADASSDNWNVMDELPVPTKLRGKKMTVAFMAGVNGTLGTNHTSMIARSGLGARITFAEAPEGPDAV